MQQRNEKMEIQLMVMDEAQHELLRICMLAVEELMLVKIPEYYAHSELLLTQQRQPEKFNEETD